MLRESSKISIQISIHICLYGDKKHEPKVKKQQRLPILPAFNYIIVQTH